MGALLYGILFLSSVAFVSSDTVINKNGIDIYSLKVDCKVTSRFAHTVITSRVANRANVSKEAIFEVELPKTAFITNFSMVIDGVTYVGNIKEKETAQQQYDTAVSHGQSAGLVKVSGRKMEEFRVSVNVAADKKVTFELTYEELLKRHMGKYEIRIKVQPKQLVNHFQIDAYITEPLGITFLDTEVPFLKNDLTEALSKTLTEKEAHISFVPTLNQQRKCPDCGETLIDGDFIIKYDVNRELATGDIQVVNGYFVHYFAPENIPRLPKNVIFVIDTSGSMSGKKIEQTKDALLRILNDIHPEDQFNLITFSSQILKWTNSLVKATSSHIQQAKEHVRQIHAKGATDINGAVLMAVEMLDDAAEKKLLPERSVSLIILLTDGEPTAGVTNTGKIQKNVKKAINDHYTLYCLGFGYDVDYGFLEKMALENGGIARRIYEDSDSDLQLQGFYEEVATPILLDIELLYPGNAVSELTKSRFRHYYKGSEIVVAGHIEDNNLEILAVEIRAQASDKDMLLNTTASVGRMKGLLQHQDYIFGEYTERLWAYLTIQQLLEQIISAGAEEKASLTQRALELSLNYSFVTLLTSMVVTKPGDGENNQTVLADKPTDVGNKEERSSSTPFRARLRGYARTTGFSSTVSKKHTKGVSMARTTSSREHRVSMARTASSADYGVSMARTASSADYGVFKSRTASSRDHVHPILHSAHDAATDLDLIVNEYPHFIIQLEDNNWICLVIDGRPGLQPLLVSLINDTQTGIQVSGHLIRARGRKNKVRSSFNRFVITHMAAKLQVTSARIELENGMNTVLIPWSESAAYVHDRLKLSVDMGKKLTVMIDDSVTIVIVRYESSSLGLYTQGSHPFSEATRGLLGQFYQGATITAGSVSLGPNQSTATINIHGKFSPVIRQEWKDYRPHATSDILCWVLQLPVDAL